MTAKTSVFRLTIKTDFFLESRINVISKQKLPFQLQFNCKFAKLLAILMRRLSVLARGGIMQATANNKNGKLIEHDLECFFLKP